MVLAVGLGAPEAATQSFGEDHRSSGPSRAAGRRSRRCCAGCGRASRSRTTARTTTSTRATSRPSATRRSKPGVPIWCVGALGFGTSRWTRALACDGLMPQVVDGNGSARQCTLGGAAARSQLPDRRVRRHRRGRVDRALAGGVGRGRRDVVDGEHVDRCQRS